MADVERKIARARTGLLLEQPFFGNLAIRLPLKEDNDQPTAYTNGRMIGWNRSFCERLSPAELKTLFAHEILHCAFIHCLRVLGRDMTRWNIAADYAVNLELEDAGFTLPSGCLLDHKYDGLPVERIYPLIPEQKKSKGGKGGKGKSGGNPSPGDASGGSGDGTAPEDWGAIRPGPKMSEAERKEVERDWKVAVIQAANIARQRGKLPGRIGRLVNSWVNPQLPWSTLLADFVTRTARNDYSWQRPNRRYMNTGFVLPSIISDELPEVVIVIDTSASIQEKELALFAAEVSAVLGRYDTTINLLWVDAEVAEPIETFTRADLPLQLKPRGGGGTCFEPAFEWVEKNAVEPACLIYFTDLYGSYPDEPPEYPVMWISVTDENTIKPGDSYYPPFGEVVTVK